jgi:hypothetical protein
MAAGGEEAFPARLGTAKVRLGAYFAHLANPDHVEEDNSDIAHIREFLLPLDQADVGQAELLLQEAAVAVAKNSATAAEAEALCARFIEAHRECMARAAAEGGCVGLESIPVTLALWTMSEQEEMIDNAAIVEMGGAGAGGGRKRKGSRKNRRFVQRGGNPFRRFVEYVTAWCRRGRAIAAAGERDAAVQHAVRVIEVDIGTRDGVMMREHARISREVATTAARRLAIGAGSAALMADLARGMNGWVGTTVARLAQLAQTVGAAPGQAAAGMAGAMEVGGVAMGAMGTVAINGACLWVGTNFALSLGKEIVWSPFRGQIKAALDAAAATEQGITAEVLGGIIADAVDRVVTGTFLGVGAEARVARLWGSGIRSARRIAAGASLAGALAASAAAPGGVRELPRQARLEAGEVPGGRLAMAMGLPPSGPNRYAGFGPVSLPAALANARRAEERERLQAQAAAVRAARGAAAAAAGPAGPWTVHSTQRVPTWIGDAQTQLVQVKRGNSYRLARAENINTGGAGGAIAVDMPVRAGRNILNSFGRVVTTAGGGRKHKKGTRKHKGSRKHKKGSRKH